VSVISHCTHCPVSHVLAGHIPQHGHNDSQEKPCTQTPNKNSSGGIKLCEAKNRGNGAHSLPSHTQLTIVWLWWGLALLIWWSVQWNNCCCLTTQSLIKPLVNSSYTIDKKSFLLALIDAEHWRSATRCKLSYTQVLNTDLANDWFCCKQPARFVPQLGTRPLTKGKRLFEEPFLGLLSAGRSTWRELYWASTLRQLLHAVY